MLWRKYWLGFTIKGQRVNTLDFAGHTVFVVILEII